MFCGGSGTLNSQPLLWKFDADLETEFRNAYSVVEAGMDFASSVVPLTEGGYAIVGGRGEGAVLRTDAAGEILWTTPLANPEPLDYSEATGLVETPDGTFIVAVNDFDAFGASVYSARLVMVSGDGEEMNSMVVNTGAVSTRLFGLGTGNNPMEFTGAGYTNDTTNPSEIDYFVFSAVEMGMPRALNHRQSALSRKLAR